MSYESEPNTSEALYTDVILAWRGWYIDQEDFYLTSNNDKLPWGINKTTAKCTKANHALGQCPQLGCTCGLYGVFNLPSVPSVKSGDGTYIIGLAAYWGKTIIGNTGIRAQYAKPYSLIAADKEKHPRKQMYMTFAREAAAVYGISVVTIDEAFLDFESHLPSNVKRKDSQEELERKRKLEEKVTAKEGELEERMWQYIKNKNILDW